MENRSILIERLIREVRSLSSDVCSIADEVENLSDDPEEFGVMSVALAFLCQTDPENECINRIDVDWAKMKDILNKVHVAMQLDESHAQQLISQIKEKS